jgi:transcriptional regulator with XRE-family HTH domain
MADSAFKTAFERAGMTREQFAEIIEVDPKTVQRWISGRVPYKRFRVVIARALDTAEHELWPDDVPAPASEASPLPNGAGDGEEVVRSWGTRQDPDAHDGSRLFADARDQVDILIPSAGLIGPTMVPSFRAAADQGCRVRIILPSDGLALDGFAELADHPQVEIRVRDQFIGHAVFRADDILQFGIWLVGDEGSPFVEVVRRRDHGFFDSVTSHFDRFWDGTEPVAENPPPAQPASDPAVVEQPPTPRRVRKWPGD